MIARLIEWLASLKPPALELPAAAPTVPVPEPAAPLTPAGLVLRDAITPALSLLPEQMDSPRARVIMLAIAGQEADFHHRYQVLNTPGAKGPARGLWQFERGGGTAGVLRHDASASYARRVAEQRIGSVAVDEVWRTLEYDDVLAGAFARLLLWTDPSALPAVGDVDGAWALYLRCWRPGAWTRGTPAQRERLRAKWGGYYARALAEVST